MNKDASRERWKFGAAGSMSQIVRHARLPLCITNPTENDNPIVFINPAFSDLTGYEESEVIGRNCRFLQGPETSKESLDHIRETISLRAVDTVEVMNYRKDGSAFLNALQIGPIFDDDGKLIYFFGSQLDVTEKRALELKARELANEELVHRLRNIANVMSVVTRMTAAQHDNVVTFGRAISERLVALSAAHFSTWADNVSAKDLAEFVRSILDVYSAIDHSSLAVNGPRIELSSSLASPLALTLHELATNAIKHGALGAMGGDVSVTWEKRLRPDGAVLLLTWRESGGPAPLEPSDKSGTDIIGKILTAAGGSLDIDWQKPGIVATVKLPLKFA